MKKWQYFQKHIDLILLTKLNLVCFSIPACPLMVAILTPVSISILKYPWTKFEYQATAKTNLMRHIKSLHEGRKHTCSECQSQFNRKSNLNIHFKSIHLSLKYPCDLCTYRASQNRYIKIHKDIVHKNIKTIL